MDKNSHNKTTSLSNYAFLTVHILTKGLYSFIVSLFVIVVLSQSVFAGKFKPPRRPDVVPLISHTYDNDRDHDRIDDALLKRAEKALKTKSLAVTPKDRINAQVQIDEMVNVEFIFTDQITQRQIDDFQSSGGEIDYVYKAVSNGWTGRMPLGKVKDIKSKMGDTLVLVEEAKEALSGLSRPGG